MGTRLHKRLVVFQVVLHGTSCKSYIDGDEEVDGEYEVPTDDYSSVGNCTSLGGS
jgi:hypothetical protein